MARELGIVQSVRFVGLRHDLPDVLRLFNVFLLSSFTEGISITLLEAMANGLPTVVTDVGGNPEVVIDGETGYLVPLGEDKEMAARILTFLDNPEKAREMGTNGMQRVDKSFSFSSMMAAYWNLYGVHAEFKSVCSENTGVTDRA